MRTMSARIPVASVCPVQCLEHRNNSKISVDQVNKLSGVAVLTLTKEFLISFSF